GRAGLLVSSPSKRSALSWLGRLRRASLLCCLFVFFFQAEDGIRDSSVTGVQTCALPICGPILPARKMVRSLNSRASRATFTPAQIGRASCRERVEIAVVAGEGKEKRARAVERSGEAPSRLDGARHEGYHSESADKTEPDR